MQTQYPPIPAPPEQQRDEPRYHYAARLFSWFLTDEGNTATPLDGELEIALYGARLATDARGLSTAYYNAVARAEREIAAALRRRVLMRQRDSRGPQTAAVDHYQDRGLDPSSAVPTHPIPPRPPLPDALPIPAGVRPGDLLRF